MVNPKTTSKSKNTRDMTFSESNKIDNKQIQYYSRYYNCTINPTIKQN